MIEIDKEFDAFLKALQETEIKNDAKTIPEVFGIQYKEVYITKWLAYLLRQNQIGCKLLNILLSSTDIQIGENDIEKVYTEYVFDTERRIGILIFTKHSLVGIENKIWSDEQENQTADYQNSMEKLSRTQNKEKFIGIYLHPEQNKSESNRFQNFTYTQLYDELCCTDFSVRPDSFEGMMLEQFKLYIKECLYLSNKVYPEMSELAKQFLIHSDKIHSIEEIYKAEAGKMVEWVRKHLKAKGLIPIGDPLNKTFWQIVKNEKWKYIGFHFELLWEGYFIKKGIFGLEAHLERVNGEIAPEIRNLFGISDEKEHGTRNPLKKAADIECDFSTQTAAEETVKRIIDAIEAMKTYADIADAYIRAHYGE